MKDLIRHICIALNDETIATIVRHANDALDEMLHDITPNAAVELNQLAQSKLEIGDISNHFFASASDYTDHDTNRTLLNLGNWTEVV